MNTVRPCRLVVDPPSPGAWNMAVDELLLDWAGRTGGCCWRFYRWNEPTLSLGYFQRYEDRVQHQPSAGCTVVRRATGGGAILHDRELTYSIALPLDHPLARRRLELYRAVHGALVDVLRCRGVPAAIWEDAESNGRSPQPFLCFERRAPGDVVVESTKIAGSAQRRSAAAVLQHGSVLLQRSSAAPELTGLQETTGISIDEPWLIHEWLNDLSRRLGFHWVEQPLDDGELQAVGRWIEAKYGAEPWTACRGRVQNAGYADSQPGKGAY
jgi:lipoate-protein ligase A